MKEREEVYPCHISSCVRALPRPGLPGDPALYALLPAGFRGFVRTTESVPALCKPGEDGLVSVALTGRAPIPLLPEEGTEPRRALVQAGLVTGTSPQEQVTCHLLGAESRALDPAGPSGPWPCTFCSSGGR